MARQRAHNERAGRASGGASWISYSDLMAALLLVFVLMLVYSLYQLNGRTEQLTAQQAQMESQQSTLDAQQAILDEQSAQLSASQAELENMRVSVTLQQAQLEASQAELSVSNTTLADREAQLAALQAQLAEKETLMAAQQSILDAKQAELDAAIAQLNAYQSDLAEQSTKIDDLVGMRSAIIKDLGTVLTQSGLSAKVDSTTGDIVLDSAVFFETGSYTIKSGGRAILDAFVPVYLNVLMKEEYRDYLGEIIIEGHTDTQGEYIMNLELSQNRALAVAKYCLGMSSLNASQQEMLRSILTATGRSYSDPVYNTDGSVNMDQSRRVEFKFSLRDADMIEEMNQILQENITIRTDVKIETVGGN